MTTHWLFTCSNQAHVTVRESIVAGITQTSVNPACHRCSSSLLSSLTSSGSSSERSTRFPWSTQMKSTSESVRTPMVLCRFVIVFVFSLLIKCLLYEEKNGPQPVIHFFSPSFGKLFLARRAKTASEIAHFLDLRDGVTLDINVLSGILVLDNCHPYLPSERLFGKQERSCSKRANTTMLLKLSRLSPGPSLSMLMIEGYICNSE